MTSPHKKYLPFFPIRRPFSAEDVSWFLKKSLIFLLFIKIFVNPFPQITAIHEISFYLSLLILVILLLRKETSFSLKTPLSIPFFIFAAWSVCGLFFAINLPNSIHDIYSHLIKYLLLFFLIVNFLGTRQRLIGLMWTIVLSTALFGLWQMASYYLFLGMSLSYKLKHAMPEEIPTNVIGVLTVFALATALFLLAKTNRRPHKIILILSSGILMITTLATQTRGAILAMLLVLLLGFLVNKKIGAIFLLSLLVLISLMPVKNRLTVDAIANKLKSDDRIMIWHAYWEIIKAHPLTGVGFGMESLYDENFLKKYNALVPEKYRNPDVYKAPHNFIVDIATRTGLVGLLVFFSILASFFLTGSRLVLQTKLPFVRDGAIYLMIATLAVLLQGLFENTMSGPPAIILYCLFAMMTILRNSSQGDCIGHPANL